MFNRPRTWEDFRLKTQTMKSPSEAVMAGNIRTGRPGHSSRLSLNSDGRSHPLLNAATIFTFIAGLGAFVLGMLLRYDSGTGHGVAIAAAAIGLASLLVGLVGQMVSATRQERILLVTGMVAGFVGLALGLAHGGFSG
jgi:hypothetical protein